MIDSLPELAVLYFLLPIRSITLKTRYILAVGILAALVAGCGGSGSSAPPRAPDTDLIFVSAPNSLGQVNIKGAPGAVAGRGTVTARNVSASAESSSLLEGVAEAAACTNFVDHLASASDGSFSGLVICGSFNDEIGLTFSNFRGTSNANVTVPKAVTVTGMVESGTSPISGASVTLYQAGSRYGRGAVILGNATTDSSGNFTVDYPSPVSPVVLYLLAIGGNAGGGSNRAIGLMGIAGMSDALPASVVVNELTTMAAESALSRFIDSTGQIIGSPSSNATGFENAINLAQNDLVDIGSGGPATFWSTYGVDEASCTGGSPPVNCDGLERLDTMANILAACTASSGPSSSQCNALLSNTGGGSTTLQAAHAMATSPTANVSALFGLQTATPYTPALSSAPSNLILALNFNPSGANFSMPWAVAIDASGAAWLPNIQVSSVTKLTSTGALSGNFTGGGLNGPSGIAIDNSGNAWVTNDGPHPFSVTEFNSSGSTATNFGNSTGAGFEEPLGVAIDGPGNVWVANDTSASELVVGCTSGNCTGYNFAPVGAGFESPWGVAIDASGDAWFTNSSQNYVSKLSACSGGTCTGSRFTPVGASLLAPRGLAIDAAGNLWIANTGGGGVSEVVAGCTSGSCTGHNFNPDGSITGPIAVAVDGIGNVWVANQGSQSVTEVTSSGALVGNFAPAGANFAGPSGIAIDASGNVWVSDCGSHTCNTSHPGSVSQFVGAAAPVLTPLAACLARPSPSAVCVP